MTETIAAIIWAFGVVAWCAIRFPRRRIAKRTKVVADLKSLPEQLALGFCIIGLVLLPALTLTTDWLQFAKYSFSGLAGWLGAIAMMGFLWLFYLSHKHLGKNWSVTLEVREGHGLVQDGIYKHVRHPMYSSFWLWGVAQALLIPNWIGGLAGILSVAVLYFSRVKKEEAMMRRQFGQQYDDYCSRTARVVPGIL